MRIYVTTDVTVIFVNRLCLSIYLYKIIKEWMSRVS
jgi:hypothetical protein